MSLLNALTQQIGGQVLTGLAKNLGIDEGVAGVAVSAAIPMIVGALAKNSATEDGAASLSNALQKDHDGSILDNLGGFLSQSDNGPGGAILGHVFGQKRGGIESALGQMAGLEQGQAGNLLENLAPVIMGQLGKTQRSQGLNPADLAGLLAGETTQAKEAGSPMMDMLGKIMDQDGDGSMIDDIGGMLGKFLK